MRRHGRPRARRALAALFLTGSLWACDFLDPITADPNAVPDAAPGGKGRDRPPQDEKGWGDSSP